MQWNLSENPRPLLFLAGVIILVLVATLLVVTNPLGKKPVTAQPLASNSTTPTSSSPLSVANFFNNSTITTWNAVSEGAVTNINSSQISLVFNNGTITLPLNNSVKFLDMTKVKSGEQNLTSIPFSPSYIHTGNVVEVYLSAESFSKTFTVTLITLLSLKK